MKQIKLFFTLIIIFISVTAPENAIAFPSQSGTCDITGVPTAGMPGRVVQIGASSDVAISISPSNITPGQIHQLTFTRTSGSGGFRGLLLYAENDSGDRIGEFDISNPSMALQNYSCGGPLNSTVTHGNTSTFESTFSINWTAPTNYFGYVTFSSIVYDNANSVFNIPTPLAAGLLPQQIPAFNNWSFLLLIFLLIAFIFQRKINQEESI